MVGVIVPRDYWQTHSNVPLKFRHQHAIMRSGSKAAHQHTQAAVTLAILASSFFLPFCKEAKWWRALSKSTIFLSRLAIRACGRVEWVSGDNNTLHLQTLGLFRNQNKAAHRSAGFLHLSGDRNIRTNYPKKRSFICFIVDPPIKIS